MNDLKFKMSFKGIGPHINSILEENVSSINMAIYADNGSGKSFISKSFKRVTDLSALDETSLDKINELTTKTRTI